MLRKIIMIFVPLFPESRFFRFKVFLLNLCGHKISYSSKISSSIKIYGAGRLEIGENTWVGPNVHFYVNNSEIIIGNNCDIAPDVRFVTGSHYVNKLESKIAGEGYCKPIIVNNGCWICFGAIIHNGVNLKKCTLIASGEIIK